MTTSSPTAADRPAATDAPLMLSVSGARGIVGASMTPAVAADFAAAYGSHVKEKTGVASPLVILGRDSRPSGEMLSAAAAAGLASVGCRVIQLGIVTTPTVGVMIGQHKAHAGMAITASHNPIIWNGLKCLDSDGVAPPPEEAGRIIDRFRRGDIAAAPVEAIQPFQRDSAASTTHVARVLRHVNTDAIRARGFHVVLDSVNGAGCVAGRMLLDELGCSVAHLNGEPTGRFAHTPEPIRENLGELMSAAASAANAAVGFAQDPDADRLAIVDENGRFIGEEYTLVLAARRMLDRHGPGLLVANLSTSRMIDDLAARYPGATVRRSAVGEANVVSILKPENGLVGGEGNGGVILPEVCWVRDSLSAMALVLDLLAAEDQPLSALVDDLPRYAMIKRKMDLSSIGGKDAVPGILKRAAEAFANERIDDMDGVRIDTDAGWVHLRPSNTEPIIRLIAEAETEDKADDLISQVAAAAGLAS